MSQPGQVSHGMPPRPNETERELARLRKEFNAFRASTIKDLGRLPSVITAGTCSVTIPAGSASASTPVDFPPGTTFLSAPLVLVGTTVTAIDVAANTWTTTGFNFGARWVDNGTGHSSVLVTAVYLAIRV